MIRVVLLGSGNVAHHLYRSFKEITGAKLIQCYNRKGHRLDADQPEDQITDNLSQLYEADLYLLAVSDDAIAEVSANLPFCDRLVVHMSGSTAIDALHQKNRQGVWYPLQTFSKYIKLDFREIPICIEAIKDKDEELLKNFGLCFSSQIILLSSAQRKALHLAAVYANNFTNFLISIAKEICDTNDIPFELLHPLLHETVSKIKKLSPEAAQTGPAIRKNQSTIDLHLELLKDPNRKKIYELLTQSIQKKYGKKL